MSRSSSERLAPRLGAKSGAKLLPTRDMAKFFRDFFSKKIQRKRNGLKTSHVGKMFFRARRGQRGASAARPERGGLAGRPRPPGRGCCTAGGGMMACGGSTVAGGYIIYIIRCEDVGE